MSGTVSKHAGRYVDNIKAAAVEDIQDGATALKQAVGAGSAWLFPVHGAVFLLTTPKIYKRVWSAAVRMLGLGAVVSVAMFALTYVPQAAFLAIFTFSGPLGFVSAVPLVLSESYGITMMLARFWFLEGVSDEIFDTVLLEKGQTALAEKGRATKGRGPHRVIGRSLMRTGNRFSPRAVARYLLTLPLTFIPIVGTAAWLLLNGYFSGPSWHERLFQLSNRRGKERSAFVAKHRGAYTAFGTTSLALSLIPVVGPMTSFASMAGAALLAVSFENERSLADMGDAGQESSQGRIKEL